MNFEGKTVAFHTLGCKLNFAETSTIGRQLKQEGFVKTNFDEESDLYIINTCSVTQNADRECKQIVKKAKKANPHGKVIVIGCYAQLKPEEIQEIEGVDLVLGANEKFNIVHYLEQDQWEEKIHSCEIEEVNEFVGSYSIGDRTRAFLKVQDGCDYKCTYCTIPLARGISRSDTIDNILKNAKDIAAQNIKEIVLTGVNIGDFGKGEFGNKRHEHTFLELITALNTVDGIERIRISSIEPNLLKDDVIDWVLKHDKFVPHFHIPLQSGSDYLLQKMKRRYNTSLFSQRIDQIKSKAAEACIGIDVIVGFPGETQELFLETYEYLNSIDFSYLHVFTYSERDHTEAISMKGAVPIPERKRRNKMLRILSAKKTRQFHERNIGSSREVLWETENKNGKMFGYTDNYVRVSAPYQATYGNRITPVYLEGLDAMGNVIIEPNSLSV